MFLFQIVVVQIIIFGAVIFFLKKIMLGSTDSAVTRLNETYIELDKKKNELTEKIKQAEEEYNNKKKEAEGIVKNMQEEAEKEITDKKDSIIKKAHEESEQLVADAMASRDSMREEIRKEERVRLIDFCQDIIHFIFKDSIDDIDNVVASSFLSEFEKIGDLQIPLNVNELEIVTYKECNKEYQSKIIEIVSRSGKSISSIKNTKDSSILGGIILKFGSLVLDGSLLGKIKDACSSLKDRIEKDLYGK